MITASAILLCSQLSQTQITVTCPPLEDTTVGHVDATIKVGDSDPFTTTLFVSQRGRGISVDYWKFYNALYANGFVYPGCTLTDGRNIRLCAGRDKIDESASLVPLEDEVEVD